MDHHLVLPPLRHEAALLPPPPGSRLIRLHGESMGTGWSLSVYAPPGLSEADLRALTGRELAAILALFSPWQAESEISQLNRDPREDLQVSPAFAALLGPMLDLARASNGASDPTLGRLVDLWGFGPAGRRSGLPPAEKIAAARAVSGWQRVSFDPLSGRLQRPCGMRFDFSGSAKGLAADQISAALSRAGAGHHLIEIGGECYARGLKPDLQPWWLAVETPEPALPGWRVALNGMGLASSGAAQNCFFHAGRRYAHSIDPATGWPCQAGPVSVTVLAQTCCEADALATALMVLPLAARTAFIARRGLSALIFEADGRVSPSPLWAAMTKDDDAQP